MPYIKHSERTEAQAHCDKLTGLISALPKESQMGMLNFILSRIAYSLIDKNLRYYTINDIVGALECAKMELYRRHSFYEDQKCKENGDVL